MKVLFLFSTLLISSALIAQPEETEQQKSMAKQMAGYMDMAWEAKPAAGEANLRLLFVTDEKPYSGITSIHGRFKIVLQGRYTHTTAFNPNNKGRYVHESLQPDTYKVSLTGLHEMEGFSWEQQELILKEGDSPIIKIALN